MSVTGKTNNPNGRPKGSANKVTTDLRNWISSLLEENRTQFENDLKAVEPEKRLQIMEKLLSYALPKLQSVEQKINFDELTEEQLNNFILQLNIDSDAE